MSNWKRIAACCGSMLLLGLAPAGAALAQVKVTAANPSSAYQDTIALDVVVSGSGFDPSAKVQYLVTGTTNPGGITVRNVRFNSSKELVTTIDVAATADLASFDILVTLSSGRKGKGTTLFTVKAKSTNPESYDCENLGTLPGDNNSDAWDFNAAGNVVGRSYSITTGTMNAFYWAGTMVRLPMSDAARDTPPYTVAWELEATGISDGPAEIAVGYEKRRICDSPRGPCTTENYPVYWTGNLAGSPAAVRLDGARGGAREINRAGTLVVGYGGGQAGAFWRREGGSWIRSNIPLGAFACQGCEFSSGSTWNVNDAGIVVGQVTRADNYLGFAYVYDTKTSTGALLPIPPGYLQSNVYGIGNVTNGVFHVAGVVSPCSDLGSCDAARAVRWTVNAASLQASSEILDQMAWAEGVTDQGMVAGTHNVYSRRGGVTTQTATLWRPQSGYVPLNAATGGNNSASRGMAAGGDGRVFVIGVTNSKSAWTAARWVIP